MIARVSLIPEGFAGRVLSLHSPTWVQDLEPSIARYATLWGLRPQSVAKDGVLSCCVLCDDAVLKIPTNPDTGRAEMAALRAWHGTRCTPRVTHWDMSSGVFAMERIGGSTARPAVAPGDVDRFLRLWGSLQAPDVTGLADLRVNIDLRYVWALDIRDITTVGWRTHQLQTALGTADQLLIDSPASMVHGDLQSHNMLDDGDTLWALDPMAGAGDPLFDIATWVCLQESPFEIDQMVAMVAERAPLDVSRLTSWCAVIAELDLSPARPGMMKRSLRFLGAQS